jgi:hypothetical protein
MLRIALTRGLVLHGATGGGGGVDPAAFARLNQLDMDWYVVGRCSLSFVLRAPGLST